MEREPFKITVEIPEVPLRGLDAQEDSVHKLDVLKEKLENQEIITRSTLNQF
jgi:hypothetical protein